MTADVEGPASAATVVLMTQQPDDSGAETADRFEWQAAMAAADALSLYALSLKPDGLPDDAVDCRLVCELHEDWIVIIKGDAELVSAKHKEEAFGAYTTIGALVDEGGIGHLFARWLAIDELPTCRLVTTAGLKAGDCQRLAEAINFLRRARLAGKVANAIGSEFEDLVRRFAAALLRYGKGLPPPWKTTTLRPRATDDQVAVVSRFLSKCTLECGKPRRTLLPFAAGAMYARPIAKALGVTSSVADAVWEAVLVLVRPKMRAAREAALGDLPGVLQYRDGAQISGDGPSYREMLARTLTLQEVDVAVRIAIENPGGYRALEAPPRVTRLAAKMERGQCHDNAIERAEHLKRDYVRYWSRRGQGDAAARATRRKIDRVLLRVIDQATATATNGGGYGQGLWDRLSTTARDAADPAWSDLDDDLLLGGICDLAERCKVWFTPRFDVDKHLADARARASE